MQWDRRRVHGESVTDCRRTNITNMTGETRVEVTRGVFDPRTYREQDKVNWSRKRRWVILILSLDNSFN